MNKIKELFQSMTDAELREAVEEIKESEKTGFIGDVVRGWAKKSGEITGGFTTTDFFMTQMNILKEAAFRWCPQGTLEPSKKLAIGRTAKVIACYHGHEFPIGTIVKVKAYSKGDEDDDASWKCSNGKDYWYMSEKELEVIE